MLCIEDIKENYGINSIDLAFKISMVVQSVNGNKRIILNKEELINSIDEYFLFETLNISKSSRNVRFDESDEKEWL